MCTRTFIPVVPNLQEFMVLNRCTRLADRTQCLRLVPYVVSSIGTYNYELDNCLCNLLEPHIPTDCCALDTFTFVRETNDLSISGKLMVSFDVKGLFTNMPVEECIDLAVKYISKGNPNLKLSTA